MMPPLRQRGVVLITAGLAAAIWMIFASMLFGADGAEGFTWTHASAGFFGAMVLSLVATLITLPLIAICSASGNPLSGLFAYGAMLSFVTWRAGGMGDWLRRIEAPGSYRTLALEAFIWLLLVAGLIFAIDAARRELRGRSGLLAWDTTRHRKLFRPNADTLYAMLFCAVLGAFISYLLLHTPQRGQALWSILIAFTPAALSAKMTWRNASPAGIVISPLLVAIAVYLYVAFAYGSRQELLAAWYGKDLFNLALALPATWAGAGLVGTTMGVGWAETMVTGAKSGAEEAKAPSDRPAKA